MIRFPHLGITLPYVLKSVSIGGFEIACYGIVLSLAMVTGLLLALRVAKATGQNPDDYFDLGLTAIVIAVISARIYYVVFSWDYYRAHLMEIFNLRLLQEAPVRDHQPPAGWSCDLRRGDRRGAHRARVHED